MTRLPDIAQASPTVLLVPAAVGTVVGAVDGVVGFVGVSAGELDGVSVGEGSAELTLSLIKTELVIVPLMPVVADVAVPTGVPLEYVMTTTSPTGTVGVGAGMAVVVIGSGVTTTVVVGIVGKRPPVTVGTA